MKRNSLFIIFARERTQGVWRILPPSKCAKHEEAKAYSRITTKAAGLGGRSSEPEPQRRQTVQTPTTQPAGADVQEAQAGGAFNHQISGILCIVKPIQKGSRTCGYILWSIFFRKSLIFQAFFVFLLFQKKRIEGGKKFL